MALSFTRARRSIRCVARRQVVPPQLENLAYTARPPGSGAARRPRGMGTHSSPQKLSSDYAPLLIGEDKEHGELPPSVAILEDPDRSPPPRRVLVTVCYCLLMVVNGGMCGAFGPSLEYFERSTGLSQGVLGGAVMQNRLAKLGGTVLWGWYANRLQQQRGGIEQLISPHHLMAAVLLVSACCSATLGFTRSGAVMQIMMIVSGFMYGISDSAANLLIMWVWDYDSRKQRINVRATPPPVPCPGSRSRLKSS